jgi:hypothetical protein
VVRARDVVGLSCAIGVHGLLNVLALGRTLSRHAFKVPTILGLWVKHKHSYGEYSDHAMRNFADNFKQTFGQIRRRMAPVEVDEAAPALFAQCRFALVCGEDLSTAAAQKVGDPQDLRVTLLTRGTSLRRP